MQKQLLNSTDTITTVCETLLAETDGPLSVYQQRMAEAMLQAAHALHDLLVSLPDTETANVKKLLSYEARSHLASIIGYAEVLLDEEDEEALHDKQREEAQAIQAAGKQMLNQIIRFMDSDTDETKG